MSTGEPTAGQATPASKSRLHVSDELVKNAKGAVKAAVEILSVAAAMTQNVPYLGIISSALTELLKIYNDVDMLKSEWKVTAGITRQIKSIVDKVQERCERKNMELPEGMIVPFYELEQKVIQTLETLTRCRVGSKRWRDRARTILSRGDLENDVKQCRMGMQDALDLFMVKLQIDQTFNIDAMVTRLDEIGAHSSTAPEPTATVIGSASLPPAPAVFHGRAQEIDHIVDLLANKHPARVAILGSGGIGKTSIALTVLHHPEIEGLYGDRRFFASCEAASNADGILQELMKVFGLIADKKKPPQNVLLSHMRNVSDGLLCLDNLETPWDDDTLAVESMLARIAALPRFALLVTTRGANRPLQVAWTQPFLPQIMPLTIGAALKTWDAICGSHDDYAEKLVVAVDCVPLAVTLLAHLAESESPEILWERWELELTDLIRVHGPDHRLSSVDISVRLSLHGPRLRDDESAAQFFSILCTLPQGMRQSRISAFVEAYAELLPNMPRSIALLKQCSLAFSTEDGFLRVLSPVRHYMQTHYPITTTPLFICLATIYRNIVQMVNGDWAVEAEYARNTIQPELGNITAVLKLCLNFEIDSLEQTAKGIASFSRLCHTLPNYDTVLLSNAIAHCSTRILPAVEANLWYRQGLTYLHLHQIDKAVCAMLSAQSLYDESDNRLGTADSLICLGDLYMRLNRLDEAEQALSSAQSLYFETGNRPGKANSLINLGDLYVRLGRLDDAERALLSAQSLYGEINNRLGKANVLITLGDLYMRLGRLEEAERALSFAQNLSEELSYWLGQANSQLLLGDLYMQLGRLGESERKLLSAQILYNETDNRAGKANSLRFLGDLYMRLGRLEEAERALSFAQSLYGEVYNRLNKANCLYHLGDLYMRLDRLDDAESALQSAQRIYDEIGNQSSKVNTLVFLGILRRRLLQYDEALVLLESANLLSLEISYLWGQNEARRQIELVHANGNKLEEVEKCIEGCAAGANE